jgi:hypothetical protein
MPVLFVFSTIDTHLPKVLDLLTQSVADRNKEREQMMEELHLLRESVTAIPEQMRKVSATVRHMQDEYSDGLRALADAMERLFSDLRDRNVIEAPVRRLPRPK